MLCRELERQVLALAEDELPSSRKAELEAHLQKCDRCASLVSEFRGVVREIDLPQEGQLSPQFWRRLHRRVLEQDAREGHRLGKVRLAKLRLRPVAAAACLLFGLWGGSHLGESFVERVGSPLDEEARLEEDELLPLAVVLGDVPPNSLAALLAEDAPAKDTLDDEAEP